MSMIIAGLEMVVKVATTCGGTTMALEAINKAKLVPEAASAVQKVCCGVLTAGVVGKVSDAATGYIIDEVKTVARIPEEVKTQSIVRKEQKEKEKLDKQELEDFKKRIDFLMKELEDNNKKNAK